MKKNIFIIITILIVIVFIGIYFIVLSSNNNSQNKKEEKDIKDKQTTDEFINEIDVIINDKNYNLILEDNSTTRELVKDLPFNFNMQELNGNEKYIYLDKIYPTNSSNPKHITKGDVMLYGDDCLVIFYKSFITTYNYTRIGHIDNLEDLDNQNINVKFNKTK